MEEMARRIDRSGREGTTGVSQGSLPVHVAMVSMGTHAPALLKIRDAGKAVCQSKSLKEVNVTSDCTEEYSEDAFFVGAVMESTTDVIERPDSENDGGTACKWQSC